LCPPALHADIAGFYELDAGRAPLIAAIDGAGASIDLYIRIRQCQVAKRYGAREPQR